MGEALTHGARLDRPLEGKRLRGSPIQSLVARVIRIAHSA
ncbi:protein of unassigned function [Methylobacterium oryzae CBMB20]|uniref:Protein of unassigned function n=1 Tax=Methylobacterium oryzae CBMB20 TaxID=693986 RepID=A0A089QBR8_9HYPH|nr:protein of unassigned function [Methylobacterium oryzae CBMB20]